MVMFNHTVIVHWLNREVVDVDTEFQLQLCFLVDIFRHECFMSYVIKRKHRPTEKAKTLLSPLPKQIAEAWSRLLGSIRTDCHDV